MKPKYWQTSQFKALEKEWYERLEQSGFEDAEEKVNGRLVLKQWAANSYRGACPLLRENKLAYFTLIADGFHRENAWRDWIEVYVMEQRALGATIKDICATLAFHNERCHRETIRLIIHKYERRWGIRKAG